MSVSGEQLYRALRTRVDITVETLAQRNALLTYQRRWGMLVVVYEDPEPANNGIYKLHKFNEILADNNNWRPLQIESILQDGIISGGAVAWSGTGLTYVIGETFWILGGVSFSFKQSTEQSAAAHATLPRFDLIYLNNEGGTGIRAGTPAENPVVPSIVFGEELYLTHVLIPAAATEPEVEQLVVYDENTEWDTAVVGHTAVFDAEINPSNGTKHIHISVAQTLGRLIFSQENEYDINEVDSFVFDRLPIEVNSTWYASVMLKLNDEYVAVSDFITLAVSGFQAANYSAAIVPRNLFTIFHHKFDTIELVFRKQGPSPIGAPDEQFYVDYVRMQGGITVPVPDSEFKVATAKDVDATEKEDGRMLRWDGKLQKHIYVDPPTSYMPNGITRIGGIISLGGLTIRVGETIWIFGGVELRNRGVDIVLDDADPTHDRYDTIYVDSDGEIGVITGTPAETPVIPQVDLTRQLYLTHILIRAGESELDIDETVVYDEDDEWSGSASGMIPTFDADIEPSRGSLHMTLGTIQHMGYVEFQNTEMLVTKTIDAIAFDVKLTAALQGRWDMQLDLYKGEEIAARSNLVMLGSGRLDSLNYRTIIIPANSMQMVEDHFDKLRITFVRQSGPQSFQGVYMDYIRLQGGIVTVPPSTEFYISQAKDVNPANRVDDTILVWKEAQKKHVYEAKPTGEGGGSGGHTLQTPDGTDLPTKPKLRAKGGLRLYNEAGEEVDFTSLVLDTLIELGVADQGGNVRTIQAVGSEANIDVAVEPKGTGSVKSSKWAGQGKKVLGVDNDGKSNLQATTSLVSSDLDIGTYLVNEESWDQETNTCAIPNTVSFDRGVRGQQYIARNPGQAATFKYFCDGEEDTDVIWIRTPWTKPISPLYVTRNADNEDDYDEITDPTNYNTTTGKYEGDDITTIKLGRIIIHGDYMYILSFSDPADFIFRLKRHI